jgi:hypothetical protein
MLDAVTHKSVVTVYAWLLVRESVPPGVLDPPTTYIRVPPLISAAAAPPTPLARVVGTRFRLTQTSVVEEYFKVSRSVGL